MTMMTKVKTGVPGFDVLTFGGIPIGRSTLVVGRSGTGKTIFGLQTASHLARTGTKTIIIGIEETAEDLLATGDALGFNLSGLFADGRVHVAEMMRPLEEPTIVSGDYDLFGLVHRIEHIVKKTGAKAIVLDSATALFSPRPPQDLLRNHFFQLVHCFRRLGLTAIILAEAPGDYAQLTTLGVEDYVCDMVVIMRLAMDGERRRRSIEINRYRRSPHYKGEFPCTITTKGLAIFPLDAPDRPESEQVERYSSGIPGLDEMTHGGFLRNSIMLVRGPTGSGKTMLAGVYARAGAKRAERVVYYGFEEPRPTLIRNFDEVEAGHRRTGARRQLQTDLPLPGGDQPRRSAGRPEAGARGVPAFAGGDGQHLLDRACLVREGFSPVHDWRGVDPARPRAQRTADADGAGGSIRGPHRALSVDHRRRHSHP